METRLIRKIKFFGAWNDHKEEAWLGAMAQEGWHLHSLGFPGIYHFTSGTPREDVYRLDFITDRKEFQNYLQLFQDAGWEHIGEMGGWQYFRTRKKDNQIPEIYTDSASKSQKYSRLLAYLIIFMPIYIIMVTRPLEGEGGFFNILSILKLVFSLFLILYAYAIIRIIIRISQIRKG